MIVVVLHNPVNGQVSLAMEPSDPGAALQLLSAAAQSLQAQLTAPQLIMPDGQAHPVMPQAPPPDAPPAPPAPPQ